MTELRRKFEARFAVPEGIRWIEEESDYEVDGDTNIMVAARYYDKWTAYQAAYADAVEACSKRVDAIGEKCETVKEKAVAFACKISVEELRH